MIYLWPLVKVELGSLEFLGKAGRTWYPQSELWGSFQRVPAPLEVKLCKMGFWGPAGATSRILSLPEESFGLCAAPLGV